MGVNLIGVNLIGVNLMGVNLMGCWFNGLWLDRTKRDGKILDKLGKGCLKDSYIHIILI